MSIPFSFPSDSQNYLSFQNIQMLRAQLAKQRETPWISLQDFKVQKRHKDRYLYARCKNCKACIRYKWSSEDEVYKLTVFNNRHNHKYQQRQNEQVIKFINELPFDIQLATARKIAVKKFAISSSKFYHMFSKIKRTKTNLHQLIKQLQDRDYDISLDPFPIEEGTLPNILVIVTPQMKQLFKLYGQTVCYDLTYNLIQEISPQRRQYAVGIFTGVNCHNRIIPFGISITCQQTSEAFTKIFQTFIEVQGCPRSLITDEQNGMISALTRLKNNNVFTGSHLFDSFHVIRNFGKMTENKELMTYLSEIIREEANSVFENKVRDFKRLLKTENQLRGFQLFVNKIDHVCFSQLPPNSFVIFNSSNSINQKMNDLVKRRIRIQKRYHEILRILISFAENIISTSNNAPQLYDFRIEELFDDTSLKLCRFMLAKRPMKQFLRQYIASMSLKEPNVKEDYQFVERPNIFYCSVQPPDFECSCGYFNKTGIPCRHILYICRQRNIDYLAAIHERWKFSKKILQSKPRKMNRATRRK